VLYLGAGVQDGRERYHKLHRLLESRAAIMTFRSQHSTLSMGESCVLLGSTFSSSILALRSLFHGLFSSFHSQKTSSGQLSVTERHFQSCACIHTQLWSGSHIPTMLRLRIDWCRRNRGLNLRRFNRLNIRLLPRHFSHWRN